jgi:tRNA/tmRNA/rRNA uracil-C5-methylase (TrmA/RlmC/RlmD family)
MESLQDQLQLAERREKRYSSLEESATGIEDRMKYRKLKNRFSDQADELNDLIEKENNKVMRDNKSICKLIEIGEVKEAITHALKTNNLLELNELIHDNSEAYKVRIKDLKSWFPNGSKVIEKRLSYDRKRIRKITGRAKYCK